MPDSCRIVLDALDELVVGPREGSGEHGEHVDHVARVVVADEGGLVGGLSLGAGRRDLGVQVGVGPFELPGRDRGRQIAGCGAPHAVGHHQHGRRHVRRILVVGADQPDLGVGVVTQRQRHELRPPR
jgi:hypothetical protein